MHSALKFYFTGDGERKALATSPLTLAVGPQETSRMSWQTINQVRLHLYGLLPFISISLTSQGCTEVVDRTGRCCTQIRFASQRDERPQYRDRIQQSRTSSLARNTTITKSYYSRAFPASKHPPHQCAEASLFHGSSNVPTHSSTSVFKTKISDTSSPSFR